MKYGSIPTNIGLAKLRNASVLGTTVDIVRIVFGDSAGVEYEPIGTETTLKNQVYETAPLSVSEAGESKTWVEIEAVIPHNVGGWYVREYGCYDADGDLIFIGNLPPSSKPSGQAGLVKDMAFELTYDASAASVVSISIDPAYTIATRKYVDSQDKAHVDAADPHEQYVRKGGFGDDFGDTLSGIRSTITTEDLFLVRSSGVYKVQNGGQTANLNRPPINARKDLYGILVVDRAEIGSENRLQQTFYSTEGQVFVVTANSGVFSLWKKVYQDAKERMSFSVSGSADAIVLTSGSFLDQVRELSNHDQFTFVVNETSAASSVTVKVDELSALNLHGVNAKDLIKGAVATIIYIDGTFYLKDQVNPLTGTKIKDIGKIFWDTTDVNEFGEYVLDGSEIRRDVNSIAWTKISRTSNLIDQATKDADPKTYAGYYGTGDGSTTFTLPILGKNFVRSFDESSDAVFGQWNEDAIRNITGLVDGPLNFTSSQGAFVVGNNTEQVQSIISGSGNHNFRFDASLVVPTAEENRPVAISYFAKTRL